MLASDLINIRHTLHTLAEVSGKEEKTSKYILDHLKKYTKLNVYENIGGNGILVSLNFNTPGKKILFRAEIDALPIQEINNFNHKSNSDGISHKCGHDGHSTILLGLIDTLYYSKNSQSGTCYFLFQPSEENGEGAKAVLGDKIFQNNQIDFVFALHNVPNYPLKQVICKEAEITPAVVSFKICFHGKTSHAAEPENGINPALYISNFITFLESLQETDNKSENFTLLTPVHIQMGEIAYGVSAGYGEIHYTLRAWKNNRISDIKQAIEHKIKSTEKDSKLSISIFYLEEFKANTNDPYCVSVIKKAANSNKLEYVTKEHPFKWGEDFGLFTDLFKGAMFGLGSGIDCPALHNPDYDFPNALIEPGIQLFYSIWKEIQN